MERMGSLYRWLRAVWTVGLEKRGRLGLSFWNGRVAGSRHPKEISGMLGRALNSLGNFFMVSFRFAFLWPIGERK